jgi:uncharacterized protein YraI
MLKSLLSIAALTAAATAAVPAVASASPAQVTANVNLRTGPGTEYYPIVVLPAGAPVELYGCLEGYTWCDIAYGRERGWVSSRYLSTFYSGPAYRPRPYRSVPYLTFNFGYWDNHYAHRPWYNNRPRDWDRDRDYRPRPDWDRDRRDWNGDRRDWQQNDYRPRQDWNGDRDRPRPDWNGDRDRPRPDWDRNRSGDSRNESRPKETRRDGNRQVRPHCPDDGLGCMSLSGGGN